MDVTRLLVRIAMGCLALLGGCASEWEGSYTPAGASVPSLAADAPVRVREVPWQRLDTALGELEAQREASDAPPDEWPAEKKAAAKARLLKALQVTADPERVEVLGRSAFTSTGETNPNNGALTAFARRIGADTVVWSSNYLGRTQVVRDEPVTEFRTVSGFGGRRSRTFTETSTIWVPVVVVADEHAFLAYYLRELRPAK